MFAYHASHASPTQGLLCKALPAQGLPCISSFGIFHPQEPKATGGGAGCLPSSSTAALWSGRVLEHVFDMYLVYICEMSDLQGFQHHTGRESPPWHGKSACQSATWLQAESSPNWHRWVAESLADVLRPPFPGPNGGVSGYIWTKPSEFWEWGFGGDGWCRFTKVFSGSCIRLWQLRHLCRHPLVLHLSLRQQFEVSLPLVEDTGELCRLVILTFATLTWQYLNVSIHATAATALMWY